MNVSGAAIKFAEKNGIPIPEFVKFLASPAGYTLSKVFDAIETQANLPQGILGLVQNPSSAATNYIQTQVENSLYGQNNPSKIENIISELQGANPDKPNFVGPQEEDSYLSQVNTSMLPLSLGVAPSEELSGASLNNMNDDLRSGLYGTITPNAVKFVGPHAEDSQTFQFDTNYLPITLGVQPTSNTATTSTTADTNSSSTLPALTPEFLQSILAPPPGVDPSRDAVKDIQRDMSPIFGNVTPESLGFTEATNDYGSFGGGGGGKYLDDISAGEMAFANGGFIRKGIR